MSETVTSAPLAAASSRARGAGPWPYGVVIGTTLIWGGTTVISKLGVGMAPAAGLATARFLIAAVCLAVIGLVFEPRMFRLQWRDVPLLATLGVTGVAVSNLVFFAGLQLAPVTDAALIAPATNPLWTSLFAALLLGERYRRHQYLGMALSLVGTVCIVAAGGLTDEGGADRLRGDLYLLASSASWSLYTVLGRRSLRRFSSLASVTWAALFGCVPLLVVSAPIGWTWLIEASPTLWAATLYLSLMGSVVALLSWSWSVRDLGAARAGQFTYLVPVWSLLLAAAFLGERPGPLQITGGVLVLGGIWYANRRVAPAGIGGGATA